VANEGPPPSGVRTEHDLRRQLRECMEKCERFERALREAHRYAYGHREGNDLAQLKKVLTATGFPKNLAGDAPDDD
jgi:hypothetical protein